MSQMRVFLSHSSHDNAFADALVQALRWAGADVWYDEHNLGAGVLRREIMRELANRPVFVVLLSKAAFASEWVQDECEWAYNLFRREPNRLLLPITAALYESRDFNALLYLESFRRVEGSGHQPYPPSEAIERTLHILRLGAAEQPSSALLADSAAKAHELIERGKVAAAQQQYGEARPFFFRAAQLAPDNVEAWSNLGYVESELHHWDLAIAAYQHVLALGDVNAGAWNGLGWAFASRGQYAEALSAYEQSLALDPEYAQAWHNKGLTLHALSRDAEAQEAERRARELGG